MLIARRTSSHFFFLSLSLARSHALRTHSSLRAVPFPHARTHARLKEHFFPSSSSSLSSSLLRRRLLRHSFAQHSSRSRSRMLCCCCCCSVAVLVTSISSSSSSARCSFHRANFRIASILMAPNRPTLLLGLLVEYISSGGPGSGTSWSWSVPREIRTTGSADPGALALLSCC